MVGHGELIRFEAVLFDCDGVLVNSEPITNGVLRDQLAESGWDLTPQQCFDMFVGHAVRDKRDLIEANTGSPLTEDWMREFYRRRDVRLKAELMAMPGAVQAVADVHARLQGRIACASGADRAKVVMQLAHVGMAPYFEDRIFSGHDMPRSKPHPDVYLAAAAHLGVDPTRCLVIEDTPTGARAGLAAGATVWGYNPQKNRQAFAGLPVHREFADMGELARLMGQP